MEPKLVTDPNTLDVLRELMDREPIFHRREFGTSRAQFEHLTDPGFWEVGASGRLYSREYVLDELERRYSAEHEDEWNARDFHCLEIADDNYLLTYTLFQGSRVTRRSTIWRRTPDGWRILFHQGTLVQDVRSNHEVTKEQ